MFLGRVWCKTMRHCAACNVLFRLLARYFILLVQNKVPKQKDTPLPRPNGFPALLDNSGGCGTRWAFKTARVIPNLAKCWSAKSVVTVLAEIPWIVCVVPARGMSAKCPLLRRDLGAIGVVQDNWKPATHRHSVLDTESSDFRSYKKDARFRFSSEWRNK